MLMTRLRERLKTIPGVRTVAPARREPLWGSLPMARVSTGARDSRVLYAGYNEVTPEYFAALDIPVTRGRAFTTEETRFGAAVGGDIEAPARGFLTGGEP